MVHNRVLGLHQLAGFLVTDAACRLVMPECLSGLLHESRPTIEVLAILHVLGITEENLLVIVDVGTEVALVPSLRDGTLFDDGQWSFLLSSIVLINHIFPMVTFICFARAACCTYSSAVWSRQM